MSEDIFPIIQPEAEESVETQLPLCRETAWDFERNRPIFSAGSPLEVTGRDAVKVWCYKALHTVRGRHEIYTTDYGSELQALIGQAYTDDVKRSEAIRYIRESLEPCPYVVAVREISADFSGGTLTICCTVDTIYGEVQING